MRNIAIVGKMYSGKTTLAQQMVNDHGYTRVAMAGPLKALAQFAYGEVVEKDKEYETISLVSGKPVMKTGRTIYQEIGQTMKIVDRDIWLKCFIGDTNQMQKQPYVVDDVRFVFEADYLRSHGWFIVKASTPESVRIERATALTGLAPNEAELNHESEREVESIMIDLLYDGTTPLSDVPKHVETILDLANGE